jgi:hypothetical protein
MFAGVRIRRVPRRFPIRFDKVYGALSTVLFLPPAAAYVEIDGEQVEVRMGWAFRSRFPRSAVASTAALGRKPLSQGVQRLISLSMDTDPEENRTRPGKSPPPPPSEGITSSTGLQRPQDRACKLFLSSRANNCPQNDRRRAVSWLDPDGHGS